MTEINTPIRVRFAPSPTGFLHIGGVRTALFNWLFARNHGGQFILRVEDTDEKRFVPGAAEDMMRSLEWVGMDWDEGPDIGGPHSPYTQSERLAKGIYAPYIDQLLASGHAYKSFTTEDEESQMREAWVRSGNRPESFRFRGPDRDWLPEQTMEAEAQGKPYTIRLKTPSNGVTSFSDLVRGKTTINVNNTELYDLVLVKTSGMPTYHLAHLIDDYLMKITHVLRGEEWVSSTPYHVILYQAFGWTPPIFAHVPQVSRPDGRGKLSKRKDDVATNRFWERGYLPEAMFNYLALQGWSYDDHTEIMTPDEIIQRFTLDKVQASPARWNHEKLRSMNGIYIRKLSTDELVEYILPFLIKSQLISPLPTESERTYISQLAPLIQERMEELSQASELLSFFLQDITYPEPELLIPKKTDRANTIMFLEKSHIKLSMLEVWEKDAIESSLRGLSEEIGVKAGLLFNAIRVAVTGVTTAPPLFDTLFMIGKDRVLSRLSAARYTLNSHI